MAVLIPSPKDGDWTSLRSAIRKLASLKLGSDSKPTFAGLTLTDSLGLSYLTEGSVLFAGSGGSISQDNTNFSWDDATDTLTVADIIDSGLTASKGVYTDGDKKLTSTGPSSGVMGYWSRAGTVLSTATSGDGVTLTGSVGIGAAPIANNQTYLYQILTNQTGDRRNLNSNAYWQPAGALGEASSVDSILAQSHWNTAVDGGTLGYLNAIHGDALTDSGATGDLLLAQAVAGRVRHRGSGDIIHGVAVRGHLFNDHTDTENGSITNGYCFLASGQTDKTSGTITNRYGLYVEDTYIVGSGLVTNQYAIYCPALAAGTGSNYFLYNVSAPSDFGIGNITTSGTLGAGATTLAGNLDMGANDILLGYTNDYKFTESTLGHLAITSTGVDQPMRLQFFNTAGIGAEAVGFDIFGYGTYDDVSDSHRLIQSWNQANSQYEIYTIFATTGAARNQDLVLYTTDAAGAANTDQLKLNSADGSVSMPGDLLVKSKLAFSQVDLNEYIVAGGVDQLDFGATATHRFLIGEVPQIELTDGVLAPFTDSDVDLGTTTHRFKDAYVDTIDGFLATDKIAFTQVDGNEYIDSLTDGYMDYGATTGHVFYIGGTEQVYVADSLLGANTDSIVDIGTTDTRFRTAYIDSITCTDGATFDTKTLVVDAVNHRVGVGVATPASMGHFYEDSAGISVATGVTIEQDGAGDAILHFVLTGLKRWSMGIDNSNLDGFLIGMDDQSSNSLGGSRALRLDTAYNMYLNEGGKAYGGVFSTQSKSNVNEILDVFKAGLQKGSGAVAAGFGLGYNFALENSSGSTTNHDAGRFEFVWEDPTVDHEDVEFNVQVMSDGVFAKLLVLSGATGNVGIDVADPHSKLEVNGAISSATATIHPSGQTDDTDVSGINVLYIDADGANNALISGFTGGVAGQVLYVSIRDHTKDVTMQHLEGASVQDLYMHDSSDETLNNYGGWTFTCDGTNWHDVSHARHV